MSSVRSCLQTGGAGDRGRSLVNLVQGQRYGTLEFTDVADANLEADTEGAYVKLPHPDGEGKNVGSPLSKPFVAAFEDELEPYEVSKGTIRFPLSQPVPAKLIGRIAKFRAREVAERGKAKATAPKGRWAVRRS